MAALTEAKPVLTPADLAELISSFTEVTTRLERTHESLRHEVSRLQGELREANEQLQRSKRLAALGEMAAGIAHEVRNPLGSIRLYARMLEQDLADRPAERSLANRIAGAVTGLDAVVGDVLSFAREMRVDLEPIDPGELMERVLSVCTPVASISVRTEAGREPMACDGVLMHRALVNIVRNAIQAMDDAPPPPGGHMLTLEVGLRSGECIARVTDTGPGLPQGVIDRMFNPFFTTRKTGTGLGLAIVHRIVDAHGGCVRVQSRPEGDANRGATFELAWPARTEIEDHGQAPSGSLVPPVRTDRAGGLVGGRSPQEMSR